MRGVERITARCDWLDVSLRLTADERPLPAALQLLRRVDPGPTTLGRGHGFYERMLRRDDTTAWVHLDGKGDAAGTILLTMTGRWWADRADPDAVVRDVFALDGHVARFDLAADFAGGDVSAVAEAIERREWVTRMRSATEAHDLISGRRTVYLGSKASDRRIRIYDVRGPVRIEVMARNEVAAGLLESVATVGSPEAHRAAVLRAVDFPTVPWWGEALTAA
jgi:hypothetical protein